MRLARLFRNGLENCRRFFSFPETLRALIPSLFSGSGFRLNQIQGVSKQEHEH